MMTRQHFEEIARILRQHRKYCEGNGFNSNISKHIRELLVDDFVKWLGTENPRFQPDKFIEAVDKD